MLIALCGASGAGKTTIAREFVRRNKGFVFGETSTSAVMRAHGMDPAKDYPLRERIAMQVIILYELDKFYAGFTSNAIFDRTPLDAAAFLLADIQRENVDDEDQAGVISYVSRAIEITNKRFTVIVGVPPVIPLVTQREGKAPPSPAYTEHIHQLIMGLRCDERMHAKNFMLPRNYTELDLRVRGVEFAVGKTMRNFMTDVETNSLNGLMAH